MIELLYTTLVLFGFFFPLFLVFPVFKFMKIIIISFQLILSFILLFKNFYKKHSLYNPSRFQNIHTTDFYPITGLYKTNNIISFNRMTNNKFSLIETEKYSKQCLEHYFISENESCPITDIKIGEANSNIYHNYIQLNDTHYIYYTKENKLNKLYKSFNYIDYKDNNEDIFSLDKIIRKEYNKLSNPILDFKYFTKYFDVICPLLIFSSIIYSLFEPLNHLKCNFPIIVNFLFQIIIFILYLIRFMKFIDIKNFLFDNKDIYKDDSYYPIEIFNIDSFPFALSLNLFLYYLLFILFPKKIACFEVEKNICYIFKYSNKDYYYLLFMYLIQINYFIYHSLVILNDVKILNTYNNLNYNWNKEPIKSINLIHQNNSNYDFIWKNNYFKLEKLDDFNYLDIYLNNNIKICGKDSYGNNLYFPEDVECPINNIFISELDEDLMDYVKLQLINDIYLYYTNKFIEGKIVVDLVINSDSNIPLNPKGKSHTNYNSLSYYD